MAVNKMLPIAPGTDINTIINGACQNLQAQGYEVVPAVMSAESATLTVKKDRDGFKNVMGLGLECRTTIMLNGNTMNVNIDHEWSNKIIALAVGWILCWVPFITGIVGAVNQNSLPEKISNALMAASAGGSAGGYQQPYQQAYQQPYQQPYEQQPYQQGPYDQGPQA